MTFIDKKLATYTNIQPMQKKCQWKKIQNLNKFEIKVKTRTILINKFQVHDSQNAQLQ